MMNRLVFLLLTALALSPALLFSFPQEAEELIERREFVIAMDREDIHFHPLEAWSIEMAQVFHAVSEGLFSYHPETMEPEPAIAVSVESEEPQTWVISLREDAYFSNGDPITAHTFKESWLYLIDPDHDYEYASMLDIIKGVRAYRTGRSTGDISDIGISVPDDYTLKLELTTPAPYLLNILCHHSFAPLHPENRESLDASDPEDFISSGAFAVASAAEEGITLSPNTHYWDRESLMLETVRIKYYDSQWALISDLQSALVHWSLMYVNPALLSDTDLVIGYPEYSTGFYYFSAEEGPYADPRVREALARLIPWREIRSLDTFFVPAASLVPQTEAYYGTEAIQERDEQKAQELLASAGYPEGEGLPPLNIVIYPGSILEDTTERLAEVWETSIDVNVSVDVRPYREYAARERSLDYDIAFLSWVGDFYDPYSFLALWHSDSSLNLGGQYNPIYDSMIDEALKADDEEKRYELFREAEQYLLDEGTVMPLFHGVSINLFHHSLLGGWSPNLLDIHPIKHLYFRDQPDSPVQRDL